MGAPVSDDLLDLLCQHRLVVLLGQLALQLRDLFAGGSRDLLGGGDLFHELGVVLGVLADDAVFACALVALHLELEFT